MADANSGGGKAQRGKTGSKSGKKQSNGKGEKIQAAAKKGAFRPGDAF